MTRVADGWRRFWFEPQPTSTAALVRIAFGLLVFVWTLTLVGDLMDFFTANGVVPEQPARTVFMQSQGGGWGLLDVFHGDAAVVILWVVLLAASAAFTLGFFTRLAALVMFVGILSFERRNPFVFNSGDYLIRNMSFLLLLVPAGVALSLDRLRRAGSRFWEFPARAPWGLRLLQIETSVIYLSTVWDKVQGNAWNDGTAVGVVVRIEDLTRFPVPNVLSDWIVFSNLATYGTLITELAVGILIWNRAARPYVIAAGVGMHLFIDYSLRVGLFSYAMFVLYVAFVPPERASAFILAVRDRLAGSRRMRALASRAPAG